MSGFDSSDGNLKRLLAAVKQPQNLGETKERLQELRSHVKTHLVNPAQVGLLLEIIRATCLSPQLTVDGLTMFAHLGRRLRLQNIPESIGMLGTRLSGVIVDKLGDNHHDVRKNATADLTMLHAISPQEIESQVLERALLSKNAQAKKAGMAWVIYTHQQNEMPIRAFVPSIVACLEDADGEVRDIAKTTIVSLFLKQSEAAKSDLQKQMDRAGVRIDITEKIWKGLGSSGGRATPTGFVRANGVGTPEPQSMLRTSKSRAALNSQMKESVSADAELPPHMVAMSNGEQLKPLEMNSTGYFHLPKDLSLDLSDRMEKFEDYVRDVLPSFEGKESEHNWLNREKTMICLRRLTLGNAPRQCFGIYMFGLKTLFEGILKAVNSLRTSLSTQGCLLLQDVAVAVGSGMDAMVDLTLTNVVKLCAQTKNISAANGNSTVSVILRYVSYHSRLLQHVFAATQDKNVRPRLYAAGWLKILLEKQKNAKNVFEQGNGLETIEKCVQRGLGDVDPGVRESSRDTFWTFHTLFPQRANSILATLKGAAANQLLQHPSNPNPNVSMESFADSKASSSAPALKAKQSRPTLKEAILAKKREKVQLERPGSALAPHSPTRAEKISRPATAMGGSISSAPIRPMRIAPKKPVLSSSVSPTKSIASSKAVSSPARDAEEDLTFIMPVNDEITRSRSQAPPRLGRAPLLSPINSTFSPRDDFVRELAGRRDRASIHMAELKQSFEAATLSERQGRPVTPASVPPMSPKVLGAGFSPVGSDLQKDSPPLVTPLSPTVVLPRSPVKENPILLAHDSPEKIQVLADPFVPEVTPKPKPAAELPLTEFSQSQINASPVAQSGPLRMIDSGIAKIRRNALDVFGHHKLKSELEKDTKAWATQPKYAELIGAITEHLGAKGPTTSVAATNPDRIIIQRLLILQLMHKSSPALFRPWMPQVICSIVAVVPTVVNSRTTVSTLEYYAEEFLVVSANPTECVEALLDQCAGTDGAKLLKNNSRIPRLSETDAQLVRPVAFKLITKAMKLLNFTMTPELEAAIAAAFLHAINTDKHGTTDMRKAAYTLATDLSRAMGSDEKFWDLLDRTASSLEGANKSLMLYYLKRN